MDSGISADIPEMHMHRLVEGLHFAVQSIRFGGEIRDELVFAHRNT